MPCTDKHTPLYYDIWLCGNGVHLHLPVLKFVYLEYKFVATVRCLNQLATGAYGIKNSLGTLPLVGLVCSPLDFGLVSWLNSGNLLLKVSSTNCIPTRTVEYV